jgi:integrase
LATVQALLGHASPATTARYDRRGERAVREAAGRVHVPFVSVAR